MLKVKVIAHTPNPDITAAAAARLCYSNTSAVDIMKNFTEEKASSFIGKLIKSGHMSPVEHVSFTFAIDGVSRTLLAQLTRHRIASYSVQSLRYNNPFKAESKSIPTDKIKLEDLYYIKGYTKYSSNTVSLKDFVKKYNTEIEDIEEIPTKYILPYIRGVFDGSGSVTNNNITLPLDILPELKSTHFNFTQDDNQILLEDSNALDFATTIYKNVDFFSPFYNRDKVIYLCKKSKKFYKAFLKKAEDFIDKKYYAILPDSIQKDPDAVFIYIDGLESAKKRYIELVNMGVLQEDARQVLPMGTQTKIVMTMNVRSLYNFFNLRCCSRAQSEIRQLANLMLKEVKKIAPILFDKAGAPCEITGICPEGKFSCGKYPTR